MKKIESKKQTDTEAEDKAFLIYSAACRAASSKLAEVNKRYPFPYGSIRDAYNDACEAANGDEAAIEAARVAREAACNAVDAELAAARAVYDEEVTKAKNALAAATQRPATVGIATSGNRAAASNAGVTSR